MVLDCPGTVLTGADGSLLCQDGNGNAVQWLTSAEFDPSQIDPATATAYMSWGFFVVIMGWAVGFGIRKAVQFIRSV